MRPMWRTAMLGVGSFCLLLSVTACGGSVTNDAGGGTGGSGGTAASGGTAGLGGSSATGGVSGTGATGGTGAVGGTGGSTSFVTAPHEPLPQIPTAGGRLLEHVELVTVSFAGYEYESEVQAFDDFIVTSNWLTTVGKDYGVGTGTHVTSIVVSEAPPTYITDDQVQSWITQKIQDGTLPTPPTLDNDYLYNVYFPSTTTIELQGTQSCSYFEGYHNSVDTGALHYAYAVLPTCTNTQGGPPLAYLTVSSSHELIEAATDADPLTNAPGYTVTDPNNPWAFIGGEVANLCVSTVTQEGGFYLQRVWSNSAAAADTSPCIPATGDYYNVSASPNQPVAVAPGSSTTFTLTGWSTASTSDWFVMTQPYMGTFQADASLDTSSMNNGKTATLTVTVPQGAPSQSYSAVVVFSAKTQTDYAMWPVVVYVP